jgi:hypothetical protein
LMHANLSIIIKHIRGSNKDVMKMQWIYCNIALISTIILLCWRWHLAIMFDCAFFFNS